MSLVCYLCGLFFFFKQKTAYEMRISDWSSDVCSSDLPARLLMPAMIDTPDLETRAAPDDQHALRLWLRMLTCCNLIESEIRGRLRTEFDTTLPRFDLMAQLQRAPKGMKMGELSRRMMVTNGNITGITDQLEKEGLVMRTKMETDRRSSVLKLTPQGRRIRSEEHTSELQSLMRTSYAVFCLNKKIQYHYN